MEIYSKYTTSELRERLNGYYIEKATKTLAAVTAVGSLPGGVLNYLKNPISTSMKEYFIAGGLITATFTLFACALGPLVGKVMNLFTTREELEQILENFEKTKN